MVINFYTPKKRLNKDCMGSLGLGFELGTGIAGLIGFAKRLGVNIPDMQTVLMATEFKKNGHTVTFKDHGGDLTCIHSSINGYAEEGQIDGISYGAMATACPHLFKHPAAGSQVQNPFGCPDWSLFDYKKFKYFPSLTSRPLVTMMTSWGCEYNCSYCPYRSYYGPRQAKPIENIKAELENLFYLGIKGIVFRDPLFTANREQTCEILTLLQDYKFKWVCETRLEKVDINLLNKMRKAGCNAIHFGIESANPEVLKSVNRSCLHKEKQKEIIGHCEKIAIKTSCFFILCFPADTKETCLETIARAIYLNPNTAEFFIAQPYPGTKMAKSVQITEDYSAMNGYTLCFKHPSISKKEANSIRNHAYKAFYLRLQWVKKFVKAIYS